MMNMSGAVSVNYGTLTQRRLRVVAMYGGYLVICTGFWLADIAAKGTTQRYAGLAVVLAGFIAFAYGFANLLRRTFINAAHVEDAALDERQRDVRDRAMRISYIFLSFVVTVQALSFMIAATWKDRAVLVVPAGVANAYFWGAFLLALTLPTAVLAWGTPDVRDEER